MIDNKCIRCDREGAKKRKRSWYCSMHFRIDTMREAARWSEKYVPSREELERLAESLIEGGMICPHCCEPVVWTGTKGQSSVITLQHDRSGTIGLLCFRCNVRHSAFPGDTFYDYPLDWKFCPKCNTAKPETEFYIRTQRCHVTRRSYCKACKHVIAKIEWAAKVGARCK